MATDDTGYDTGLERDQSAFQDLMQAPIVQKFAVDDSSTNGVCVLFDYTQCLITWNANQVPTIQLTYPVQGKFVNELKIQRILIGDINRQLTHQKFRMTEIIKSDQNVIVNGTHIIGEYLTANPIKGKTIEMKNGNASWLINQILSNLARQVPDINYDTDVETVKDINMDVSSTNALNALLDPDQQGDKPTGSVLGYFGGEFIFDGLTIHHRQHAGRRRKIRVDYDKNISSYSQEKSISNTYVGIYAYWDYDAGPALATESNVDWNSIVSQTKWSSIGSVTYNAGGSIDVYDAPVAGARIIRQIQVGEQIKLGNPISDGAMLPLITDPTKTVQVNTTNGDQWYPIDPSDGGGWVDASWINFDKTGDYVVNDAIGHVTIDAKSGQSLNRYPVSGWATVTYTKGDQRIHVYWSPDQGPQHYRRKMTNGKYMTYKNGDRIHYDYMAIDENGKSWYRIDNNEWLYGPHLLLNKEHDVQAYPSTGMGLVKKNAKKYKINPKKGTVEVEYRHLSMTEARKQHKKQYKTVYRGKGKHKKPIQVKNPDFQKGKAIVHKHKYYRLDYGQIVVGGVTYYKLSDGSYVKSSDIDSKARKTSKPTSPSKIQSAWADKHGKVEMYSAPSKGSAINWSIPDGKSFAVDKVATGADGKTWYQVTFGSHVGWIPSDSTSTTAPDDLEPQAVDQQTEDDDSSTTTATVDQQSVHVELPGTYPNVVNGVLYPEGADPGENTHIMKIDASAYCTHDDQDQSGLQPDGSFKPTDSDFKKLYQVVMSLLEEYEIGKFPVSMTVNYSDLDGDKADLLALSMYDTVDVHFTQYDQTEPEEVTGTVWEMKGQDSCYQSVTLGIPPKSLPHLLLEQADKQTQERVASSNKRTNGLLAQYDSMLQMEGSNRARAEHKMMKDLGLIQDVTDRQGKQIENQLVTNKEFEDRMQSIAETANDIRDWTLSSGGGVIQATPSWQAPEMLTATATDGSGTKMAFSGHGLVFYNADGTQRPRAGLDSQGRMYADMIKAGTIETVSIKACTINSSLAFQDPNSSMSIYIGTVEPSQVSLSPYNGGRVIWLWSNHFESMVSSGQMAVRDSNGNTSRFQPNVISVGVDDNHVLTQRNFSHHAYNTIKNWVEGWVADWITVNGKRYTIWKNEDNGHGNETLPA